MRRYVKNSTTDWVFIHMVKPGHIQGFIFIQDEKRNKSRLILENKSLMILSG
jgi:hypothetical protein